MNLEELFKKAEGGTLSYDGFKKACEEAKYKLADLSTGEYVSKSKYEDDIKAKDSDIENLKTTISTRDTDLETLKGQLKDAENSKTDLATVSKNLSDLQQKYSDDMKKSQEALKKQQYAFLVRELSSQQSFTSKAAQKEFERNLMEKDLTVENGKLIGASDFITAYKAENEDSFTKPEEKKDKPSFSAPTNDPTPKDTEVDEFLKGFRFSHKK